MQPTAQNACFVPPVSSDTGLMARFGFLIGASQSHPFPPHAGHVSRLSCSLLQLNPSHIGLAGLWKAPNGTSVGLGWLGARRPLGCGFPSFPLFFQRTSIPSLFSVSKLTYIHRAESYHPPQPEHRVLVARANLCLPDGIRSRRIPGFPPFNPHSLKSKAYTTLAAHTSLHANSMRFCRVSILFLPLLLTTLFLHIYYTYRPVIYIVS